MIFVTSIILTAYCVLIIAFILGYDSVKYFKPEKSIAKTTFSIVIPFRNEAQTLAVLLNSLQQLHYPTDKFEILFVDDDSDDDSVTIIERCFDKLSMTFKVVKNNRKTNSPKKDAIETAVKQAQFEWILTTDADCHLPKDWLSTFDAYIQQYNPNLLAAPVTYASKNTAVEKFQLLDILSLQGATMGGFGVNKPFMCNGANLGYKKQAFIDMNGFKGNKHIASGDDVFLLEKMTANHPDKVHYLKSAKAIVTTNTEPTLKKLIAQRIRWAAKATSYKNTFSKLVSLTVFGTNLFLIILLLGSLIGFYSWQFFILFFAIKFFVDFILLFKTATFFKQQYILKHYFWSSFVYPIFIIFIALSSFTSGYSWKGRKYRK